ncbi:hypothetical protein PD653_1010 [Nocardioides sp. PD653]|nr:hypothetical protein PD653B2_0401 [Nocardioides sp. PD653-B2]GAW53609.1 hypothetical protein PD653_1010 [Nocardioides sp. PD653]
MHVEPDPRGVGVGLEALGATGVAELGALVALRVAEEELHVGRLAGLRLGNGVGLVDVGTDVHAATLGTHADSVTGGRPGGGVRTRAP